MRAITGAILMGLLCLPATARAESPVVVELYTSQGCSSCPPADKLLHKLAERDDVIALALHVDYWDYIGWKDTFGSPAFTERQRGYARAKGDRTIYTPQMVVEGVDHLIGTKPMQLEKLIAAHSARSDGMILDLQRSGDELAVTITASAPLEKASEVQLVRYRPEATTHIERGENAGRTISYANIVTEINRIGEWDGTETFEETTQIDGDQPAAVIVQAADHGAILAAARLR